MILDVATVLRGTGARVAQLREDGTRIEDNLTASDLRIAFQSACIDSRHLEAGDLFFALSGEQVDGHDFVEAALTAGAGGCVVSRTLPDGLRQRLRPAEGAVRARDTQYIFQAPDVLDALQNLAGEWRRRANIEVVAVTGSIGKTTTKEIVASSLSPRWDVFKSEGNLNTEIGLPLMLLQVRRRHELAVLEMGMYASGDIALLAHIAEPKIGIVTNVAPIHLERMGTIERIARAKSELIAALPLDGLAVLNGDDPWTRAMAITSGIAPSMLFGTSADCDYRALQITSHGLNGVSFIISAEGDQFSVNTRVPGVHTVPAFLAAAATARFLGMSWNEVVIALESVELTMRQRVLRGPDGVLIIDDSYNAAPLSMYAALDLLASAPGTKIAVLGDMLELGPQEEDAHRQVGARAAEIADWLVARGARSQWIAEAAAARGLPAGRVVRADSNRAAIEAVHDIVASAKSTGTADRVRTMQRASQSERDAPGAPGATATWSVLVKGSRGMKMEEIVHGLRGEG